MATRGLYKFYEDEDRMKDKKPTAVIYRHWDNYIEGGGIDLKEFLDFCKSGTFDGRTRDASYLASKYVVFLAQTFAGDWKENPLDFLSVGVCYTNPELDMWQEYTYHIICDGDKVPVFVDYDDNEKEPLEEALEKI